MRIAAHVLFGYVAILVLGCIWRFLPLDRAVPDIAALVSVYLGITARSRLAVSVAGAIALGYLADLLVGAPVGLTALVSGTVCIVGHFVHRRILVRGLLMTALLAAFTGLWAALLALGLRLYLGWVPGSFGSELWSCFGTAALTGVLGPMVFRGSRAIDSQFRSVSGLSSPSGPGGVAGSY